MQLLLDTNVISEVMRPQPDSRVMAFLEQLKLTEQFTAAVCIALRFGIERMPARQKQDRKRIALATLRDTVCRRLHSAYPPGTQSRLRRWIMTAAGLPRKSN